MMKSPAGRAEGGGRVNASKRKLLARWQKLAEGIKAELTFYCYELEGNLFLYLIRLFHFPLRAPRPLVFHPPVPRRPTPTPPTLPFFYFEITFRVASPVRRSSRPVFLIPRVERLWKQFLLFLPFSLFLFLLFLLFLYSFRSFVLFRNVIFLSRPLSLAWRVIRTE